MKGFFKFLVGEEGEEIAKKIKESGTKAVEKMQDIVNSTFFPNVDVIQLSPQSFSVLVEIPGVNRDDLEINVIDGKLILSGNKKPVETGIYLSEGSFSGDFYKIVSIPNKITTKDITSVKYNDGRVFIVINIRPDDGSVKVD